MSFALVPVCSAAPASFSRTGQPFVARNCLACHNSKIKTAGLDLESRAAADVTGKDREIWEHVAERVRDHAMPPKGMASPTDADRAAFVSWLESEFLRADRSLPPDPGRVTARRLNRYEYNNTVRDLLGVTFHPADNFPADDSGYGFDNIGDVLSLSPVLMEKYLMAAEQIARRAIFTDPPPKPTMQRYAAPARSHTPAHFKDTLPVAYEADYEIRTSVAGKPSQTGDILKLAVAVDGRPVEQFQVDAVADKPRGFDVRLRLTPGEHTLEASLTPQADQQPVTFRVDNFEVRGPYNPAPVPRPPGYSKIFVCGHPYGAHKPECARLIIADVVRRAFRRPVTEAEVAGYLHFFDMAHADGDSFEHAIQVPLEAILVSPEFLFRIERDREPDNPRASHRIDDFELATRLSYFLWSTAPDEVLFRVAQSGTLHDPAVLETQVRRMLADPKSFALVDNFAGQWLELRNLQYIHPDPDRFPEFDKELRADMLRETQMFFTSIIHDDRSILDFIDGRYTFLNERLAKHYGIEGVQGPEFRRVDLDGNQRSGILTQASVLTVSSYPTRTSPVIRGKFILENILNTPPPPPPPNVPSLAASGGAGKLSLRQQLEEHRANAVCASCHSKMDPLGFGLENYDAIGRWRTVDGKFPIDTSGTLPNGKSFRSPAELKTILKSDKDAFAQCLAEKMLTYALGRGLERYDRPAVAAITARLAANYYRFSALVLGIVESLPFETRRGDVQMVTRAVSPAVLHKEQP